ncbi:hypothetical protein CJD36_016630 [Flavipsychrobacter stenotrophus]|uniref:Outer membrane protein beta-barrel domain-containing protein n=1 Tax=Flavipsychrobacter stenotrophus TaxID=2077091 RepID=A0A2S7SUK2_9BACT|nr:hypothetical protein CJD36_016630 [Flavipsychrobacter stenotrophus]
MVRQKFDQNDFEFSPRNWEKLTEELDGQKKKRGLLFWWMPLMGVAATVAMAFGVSTVIRHGGGVNSTSATPAAVASTHKHKASHAQVARIASPAAVIPAQETPVAEVADNNTIKTELPANTAKIDDKKAVTTTNTDVALNSKPAVASAPSNIVSTFAANAEDAKIEALKKKKKVILAPGYYTFNEEEVAKKDPKVAIALGGGVNYSSQSNGYMVGATARRMINDKVYVESDIAFIGTNNTQKTTYFDKTGTVGTTQAVSALGASTMGAKISANKNTDEAKNTGSTPQGVMRTQDQAYNLYYAQITPSIGYKLTKKLSLGVGPDFQQMLVDNRPEVSTTERGNIRVSPMFDMGFMGKTEYAISKGVKAAVYYREGINNIITPTNKYIDRNYLQFQIKCTILNR